MICLDTWPSSFLAFTHLCKCSSSAPILSSSLPTNCVASKTSLTPLHFMISSSLPSHSLLSMSSSDDFLYLSSLNAIAYSKRSSAVIVTSLPAYLNSFTTMHGSKT